MGRFFLACAISIFLGGCAGSDPVQAPKEKPITMSKPSVDTADGPALKDLPKALDLPIYPRAVLISSKIGTLAGQPDEKRYHVILETKDPAKKVIDFYAAHGIPGDPRLDKDQSMGSTPHGNLVIIDCKVAESRTTIAIKVSPSGNPGK